MIAYWIFYPALIQDLTLSLGKKLVICIAALISFISQRTPTDESIFSVEIQVQIGRDITASGDPVGQFLGPPHSGQDIQEALPIHRLCLYNTPC